MIVDASHRDALSRLFDVLGLEARRVGDDGETGWGVPDRGFDDTEAVMKMVRPAPFSVLLTKPPLIHCRAQKPTVYATRPLIHPRMTRSPVNPCNGRDFLGGRSREFDGAT